MKIKKETVGEKSKVTFLPETEEEKLIMGSLRNQYFFGTKESGTYPKYAGITTTEDNYIESMSFEYKHF
jgi:hypothetical protein